LNYNENINLYAGIGGNREQLAKDAIMHADALIKELNK